MKTRQSHTQQKLDTALLLFFIVSVSGYIWEILLYYCMNGTFTNRGFFHGPWLPVYGLGAVLLAAMLEKFPARLKRKPLTLFFLSALVCSATEYLLGTYLEMRRHMRYWDYSGWPLSIQGRVCLISFLFFGLGGLLLDGWLLPVLRRLPERLQKSKRSDPSKHIGGITLLHVTLGALCLLFTLDLIYSYVHPNIGNNISFKVR